MISEENEEESESNDLISISSRSREMANEEIKEAIIKELEKKYFLLPKHNFILFLGGLFGVMVLAIFGSYQGAFKAVGDTGGRIALEAINKDKEASKSSREIVDNFAKDIRNGNLQKEMKEEVTKSLKSDASFLSSTKGAKGDQGFKGDSGISAWGESSLNKYKGQYTTLVNSKQNEIARIGASPEYDDGIIQLSNASGSEVVRIDDRGFFILKDGNWIEPYNRK